MSGDLLTVIGAKLNVEFKWAGNNTLEEGLSFIIDGKATFLPMLTKTQERARYLVYTKPHIVISNVIFSREGAAAYSSIRSLNGKTISQVAGFSATENIKRDYPDIHILEVENVIDAILKV